MSQNDHLRSVSLALGTNIQRYFEVSFYLLVFTGFATLISTRALDIVTVVLAGLLLLVRGYLLAQGRPVTLSESWTTMLTLGYAAFYTADYLLISGKFLSATVHLVVFVMLVRLFSARRDRDYYFLAVISFLMVLAATILTVDSVFLLAFAGFMLMAIVTAILMEMRRSIAKATVHSRETSGGLAEQEMAFSLVAASPALLLLILAAAACIFFILPRISGGYLSAYATHSELAAGFSERVQLGGIGEIQQSTAAVMHIQIEGDHHGDFNLKWRGIALNLFDGTTWSSPQQPHIVPSFGDKTFLLTQALGTRTVEAQRATLPIQYRVLMEPMGANVFFLTPRAQSLQGNYRLLAMDESNAVFNLDASHPVSLYTAWSDIAHPDPVALRNAEQVYPPMVLLNYLQLPPLDPRIPRLAEQIAAPAGNNYDKAIAVESYLHKNFAYTLQLPRTLQRDPLANFLFERKQGHCEYFASSMAVMLRTLRIPSRVVNGFRTGEFNDLTSQYVIRASDAHSWVEAYFPGYGWVSFDPTPAGGGQVHTGWGRAMLYLDAMASFWREWVVDYDATHQQILGQETAHASRRRFEDLRTWGNRQHRHILDKARRAARVLTGSPSRWEMTGTLTAIFLLLAVNARRLLAALGNRRLAAHPERAPRMAATIWYERMTRMAARRGWKKSPAQTPQEFVTGIVDPAVHRAVAEFSRHYENARFGDSAGDAERLPELFEEISVAIRR